MAHELSNIILENIGDGVISADASLKIVFANKMACSIFRMDINEILGRNISEIMLISELEDQTRKIDPFRQVISTGIQGTYDRPMKVETINDDLVYIEDTISPIRNIDGEVIGAVMVFRDVSHEVEMSSLLNAANQRYRVLFDSIRSGVAVYGTDNGDIFKIIDFNYAAENIEGVEKKDIIGKNVHDVFPGVTNVGILDILRRVWKTGMPERLPCAFYEDDMRCGWRDNYIYKLPTGEIIAVYDDVTQKKETAERVSDNIGKLRDNENRLRSMFDNSAVGLVISDESPDHRIIQANKSFCDLLGYNKKDIIGKSVQDITYGDDVAFSIKNINEALSSPPSGKPVHFMKRYIHKDGNIVWGDVFLSKIEHGDGRIEHFAQVVDITDRKRAEEEKSLLATIVSELNASDIKNRNTIKNIMIEIKKFARLDAVAVRLPERICPENNVTDYPFYFHDGFNNEFLEKERSICCRDANGQPIIESSGCLECVCGAVITGCINKSVPFFTKTGSFWTNSTSDLVYKTGIESIKVNRVRGACWENGYQSVAIVPIISGDMIVGSMLLNTKRQNAFDVRMIEFFEEVGKSMGVAFSRMQLRSDIDNHRKSLARANSIMSVECDVAKNIADGSDSNFNAVLMRAGKKLGVKWLCVVVVGDSGIVGRWTDEKRSSESSVFDDFKFDSQDIHDIKNWLKEKTTYSGTKEGLPIFFRQIVKPIEGFWMIVPVLGDKNNSPTGFVMLVDKNERIWSKDECKAMEGLSTLLCILAKAEKNRMELSRKIEETILIMNNITAPMAGGINARK